VPTATPADQRRLLDIQALDTRLQQLAHTRATLPELARLAELDGQLADLSGSLIKSQTAVNDLRREVAKAEADVEQVRNRARRDQSRLDAGQVGAKDAQALVAELETLARRQGVLEEVELDAMERLEAHETALAKVQGAHDELAAAHAVAKAECEARCAEVDAEAASVRSERESAVEGVDVALIALYERVRDANGGRGVVSLRGNAVDGLNVGLSRAELAAISSAAPDQVVRLEDYGHLVVRLDA
jgi:predicted  nucleic acid-binding Zn-ribbon protein